MKLKKKYGASLLMLCLIAACLCGLAAGSLRITDLFQDAENRELALTVLFKLRLPRIALAVAVGACLGVSGAGFQAVFRNALADPFVIGSSSGAALGAGIAMMAAMGGALPVSAAAFIGSLAAVFAVLLISRASGMPSVLNLLLAGTAISSLCSSLLSFLFILKDGSLQRVYYWMLGSLAVPWNTALSALPVMFAGALIIFLSSSALDLLLQGDEIAESLGLDVKKARITVILGASLASAATVSVCGVIGFVGLIAPHSARLFTGSIHKRLLPASALLGALAVLLADIVSRSILPPIEIPIGIITALGGAPFFLFLLVKNSVFVKNGAIANGG
ncbi:MAG: iron ABC transporter permease [Treponema sp.]|nr:iron ABC transporter permease [Treponema sp.]